MHEALIRLYNKFFRADDPGVRKIARTVELDGATVCVVPGTNSELKAAKFFRDNRLNMKPVVIENLTELSMVFFAGRCDLLISGNT